MKLYFAPGACSFAVHLALRELEVGFTPVKVDLKTKQCADGDFTQINPKGYVPALKLDSGETMTEVAVILQYVADQHPQKNLFPKWGAPDRYEAMSWLNFISAEVHKSFGPIWNAFFMGQPAPEPAVQYLHKKLGFVDSRLQKQPWVLGPQYSVADMYLYTLLNWTNFHKIDISQHKALVSFQEKMNQRPTVQAALKAEHG